jgi:hypothetical protein
MNSPLRRLNRSGRHAVIKAACSAGVSVLAAALGWSAFAALPASATTLAPQVESVSVVPTNTTQNDPDGGQWFYVSLKPGQSASSQARITNPADTAQTVQLGINDLEFTPNGTPHINYAGQTDVGSWAHFDVSSVTVPPRQSVLVSYQIKVSSDAEPGDHFGVVVVRSAPEAIRGSKALRIVKVVAVRFYVTVPGIATKSFQIGKVTDQLNSTLLPSFSLVSVPVVNTGRVRLQTKVTVGGVKATGSSLILAKSTELFTAKVPVPWHGGPVSEKVVVTTNYPGVTKAVSHSQFVFPYALVALLLLLGLAIFGMAMLIRRRVRKQRRLRADLRRLEQMVLQRPGMVVNQPVVNQPAVNQTEGANHHHDQPEVSAAVSAMESAIKRARRTGHTETLPELAIALHEAGGDALDALLEAAPVANGRTPKVMDVLAGYPAERIQASRRLAKLSEPDRARLLSKGTGAVGEFSAGPRGKTHDSEAQPTATIRPRSGRRAPRQPVK